MVRLLILSLLWTSAAHAQAPSEVAVSTPPPPPPVETKAPGYRTSLMIEPIYLVLTMLDVTLEQQIAPHVSIAGKAGYGRMLGGLATTWDLGVQANVFLRANTTGWHVGGTVRLLGAGLSEWLDPEEEDGHLRMIGGYAGYAWVSDRGLTITSQIGLGQMVRVQDGMRRDAQLFPIANFAIGWSR